MDQSMHGFFHTTPDGRQKICTDCKTAVSFQYVEWDDDSQTKGLEVFHCVCRKHTHRQPTVHNPKSPKG